MCVCVCVCGERKREREKERKPVNICPPEGRFMKFHVVSGFILSYHLNIVIFARRFGARSNVFISLVLTVSDS